MTATVREHLRQQIDRLPEDVLTELADFLAFILKRRTDQSVADWDEGTWREFSLGQMLRDDSGVDYSIDDAEEVYKR